MTTNDHNGKPDEMIIRRFRLTPELRPPPSGWQDVRAFLCSAGSLLLYCGKLAIDEAHKTPEALRALLRRLNVHIRIPGILEIDLKRPHDTENGSPSKEPETDRAPVETARLRDALQDVADKVETIGNKGGHVAFSKDTLRRQLDQAPYEFPDDSGLAALIRKIEYQRLKEVSRLPSPQQSVLKILDLTRDPNVSYRKLAKVAEGDPAMGARILRHVNSAYSAPHKPITSIEPAMVRLGLTAVKSIALGFSIASANRKGACSAFNYELFWAECAARAAAARHITAHRAGHPSPDEAFAAGLLCQIGRLAFATAVPDEYADVLSHGGPSVPDRMREVERLVFGIDHHELAGEMMAEWGLPEFFWRAVLFQSHLDDERILPPGSRERTLAATLAWTETIWQIFIDRGMPIEGDLREAAIERAEKLGMARSTFPERFDMLRGEWKETARMLNVRIFPVLTWATLTH